MVAISTSRIVSPFSDELFCTCLIWRHLIFLFKYSEMGLWSKLVLDREFAIQQSPTHGSKLSDVKKKSKQLLLVLATIAGM